MRCLFVALLAVDAALSCFAGFPAGTDLSKNHIKNGSFEIGRDNFDYDGWQNRDSTGWAFSITNVASSGKRALFVEKGTATMWQYTYVPAGTYVFAVAVRANPGTEQKVVGENAIKGLGIGYVLSYRMKKDGPVTKVAANLLTGCIKDASPEWKHLVSEPIVVPEGICADAYASVSCGAVSCREASGLIDDVALYRVK